MSAALDVTLDLEPPPFKGDGRGVRVAVIDSGVFPNHPHIGGAVHAGIAFRTGVQIDPSDWVDRLGHGTAVTAAVLEKAPGAELHAVKVFHEGLRTSAATLIQAIDWCVAEGMHLVNLSLGSANPAHAAILGEAAERAARSGVVLVAAREADRAPCFPGSLPGVVSVGLDWDCPRHRLRVTSDGADQIVFASGYPRPVPGVAPARNLYGVSFAVANVTGILARGLSSAPPSDDRLSLARSLLSAA